MKKVLLPFILIFLLCTMYGCKFLNIDAFSGSTLIWESGANNYFNRDSPTELKGVKKILVTGEVVKDVYVDLRRLPWHSAVVKEYVPSSDTFMFTGAFRYDGFALCDILSSVKIEKYYKEEFYPPVDLYVEVWNENGEYAVFSWGELFYSADPYKIIYAISVSRVIPGKTGELWQLPGEAKIVSGNDHISARNISSPVKIVIKSLRGDFKVNRDPEDFTSKNIHILQGNKLIKTISSLADTLPQIHRRTLFYGQSMGFKGEKIYKGIDTRMLFHEVFASVKDNLATGMVCAEAMDGYRAAFSLSELINRTDFREPIIMYGGEEEGREGFSIYVSGDMFADRSVKGLTKITLLNQKSE